MVGVFVAFIRVVYGRMIYMSLPSGNRSSGIDIVYLQARGLVAPKPFDTRPSCPRRSLQHILGHFGRGHLP